MCEFNGTPHHPNDIPFGGYPKTWHDVALERGMPESEDGCYSGADYAVVGVNILNGCPSCGACVAPYNSYQIDADNPYAYCAQCAGVD